MRVLLAGMLLAAGCRPEPSWTHGLPAQTVAAPAVAVVPTTSAIAPHPAKAEETAETATVQGQISNPAATPLPLPAAAVETTGPDGRDQDPRNADAVYAWEDEEGSLHYGPLGDVPPHRRPRLVVADVGSISADDSVAWPRTTAEPQLPDRAPVREVEGSADERLPPSPDAYPPAELTGQGNQVWGGGAVWVWARPKRAHHLAPFRHPGPVPVVRAPPSRSRPAMQARGRR